MYLDIFYSLEDGHFGFLEAMVELFYFEQTQQMKRLQAIPEGYICRNFGIWKHIELEILGGSGPLRRKISIIQSDADIVMFGCTPEH